MGTFSELKADVRTIIIDLPTAVTNAVPRLVVQAIKAIQQKHNFKVMEAAVEYETVISTRILHAKPTDFKEFRGDPWYTREDDGSRYPMVLATSEEALLRRYNSQDLGFPQHLLEAEPTSDTFASSLEVWPLPDGNSDYDDGEYRITLPYWRYLTDLSADGDTNWFTTEAFDYIVAKAAAMGFARDWDEQRMAIWAQIALNEQGEIIKRDKLYRLSHAQEFVPHWRGAREPVLKD